MVERASSWLWGAPAQTGSRPRVGRFSRADLAAIALLVLVSGALAWLARGVVSDDAYITYRYAQNLVQGRGFVFNSGEAVLGTTSPLHGLVLGALALVHSDIPRLAFGLSWVATVATAIAVYRLLAGRGAAFGGLLAAGLLVSSATTFAVFPLETPLLAACQAWALVFVSERRWLALGAALGVGFLVRADNALLALVLLAWALRDGERLKDVARALAVTLAVSLPWLAFAWSYYGGPLSNTADVKTGWSGHEAFFVSKLWERGYSTLFSEAWLSLVGVALALFGAVLCFREQRFRALRVLVPWQLLYVAAYSALRIYWPHTWYYYPLRLAAWVLLGVGAAGVYELGRRYLVRTGRLRAPLFVVAALGLVLLSCLLQVGALRDYVHAHERAFFGGGRDRLYRAAAAWLGEQPERCRRLAAFEVGTIAYYSDRTVIDRGGLVTPRVGEQMKRANVRAVDVPWTVATLAPDCFMLTGSPRDLPEALPKAPQYRLLRVFADEPSMSFLGLYAR